MNYVYGPVPSRRLGRSLGVNIVPLKTCNYQCIYCQLGKTTNYTNTRKNFFPKEDITTEINKAIRENKNEIDCITFVGTGEPTLEKNLGDLILETKVLSLKPICVITNGALLYDEDVRNSLLNTDIILPSLDAGDKNSFIKINRLHSSLKYDTVIQGLIDFKESFSGQLWIEIMIMKGINDSKEELHKIKKKIDLIKPDRIDINVPIRPPVEKWVEIPDQKSFPLIFKIFKEINNINFLEIGNFSTYSLGFEHELFSIIKRHPMRQDQIIETFKSNNITQLEIINQLERLKSLKKIKKIIYYNDEIFWDLK